MIVLCIISVFWLMLNRYRCGEGPRVQGSKDPRDPRDPRVLWSRLDIDITTTKRHRHSKTTADIAKLSYPHMGLSHT